MVFAGGEVDIRQRSLKWGNGICWRRSGSQTEVGEWYLLEGEWIQARAVRAAVFLEGKWISDRPVGTGGEVDLRQRSWKWRKWYLLEEKWISDSGLGNGGNGICWRRSGSQISDLRSQISDLSGSQVLEMVFAGGKLISDRAVGTGVNWRRSGYQPELV